MPVENYSVVQQSENGTQFGPNNKIRFRIGSHLGYVDFHTSYLQFNLEIQNAKAKMEFSNGMGADILIRTWRLLIGGHIVEEIDHPNVLLKVLKYDYGQDLGMSEVCEVLDKSGKGTGYQGLNKVGQVDITTTNPCAVVKCVLDLDFSGIFGSSQTFPVGMTGDVEIEITLEDPRKCLQVIQSGVKPDGMTPSGLLNNGVPVAQITAGAGALTSVSFADPPAQHLETPSKVSKSSSYLNDCPFQIGQSLRLRAEGGAGGANAQYSEVSTAGITTIQNNGGATQLTVGFGACATNNGLSPRVAFNPAKADHAGTTYDNAGTLTYEVSVPSLVLQVVVPPEAYVQEQSRKVATEGYSIDIPTYTCYKNNTYAGVKSATLELPCYSSRARSLICIGVNGAQALGGNNVLTAPYDYQGKYDDLDTYQFQIGEERQPVRPVNCGNLSTFQHNVAQEQLTELEKALRSAGCNVRSLRKHKNNFVIGRALSAYGGSIPLTMKGARVYLDYLSSDKRLQADVGVINKQWFNYCAHIRRLNITPQGVSVMY
jgi:hypothetical protein